jgi:hypothetical protein
MNLKNDENNIPFWIYYLVFNGNNKKMLNRKNAIISFIILIVGLFLWFEIRPSVIRSSCSRKAKKVVEKEPGYPYMGDVLDQTYKREYEQCLNSCGLK